MSSLVVRFLFWPFLGVGKYYNVLTYPSSFYRQTKIEDHKLCRHIDRTKDLARNLHNIVFACDFHDAETIPTQSGERNDESSKSQSLRQCRQILKR